MPARAKMAEVGPAAGTAAALVKRMLSPCYHCREREIDERYDEHEKQLW